MSSVLSGRLVGGTLSPVSVIIKGSPPAVESGFEDLRTPRKFDDLIRTSQGIPFWATVPEAWETPILGEFALPGYCEVTGHCKARNDKKKVPGKNGVTTTQKGQEPAEIIIMVHIWTPAQLVRMQVIIPHLRPKPGQGNAPPVRIVHPATELLGVDYVVVDQVHLPERKGIDEYSIRIQAHEYFTPSGAGKAKAETKELDPLARAGKGALAKPTQPGGSLHEQPGPPSEKPQR